MIEALWYGLIVSLSFVGLLSILIYFLLHNYSSGNNGVFIICLPENLSESELYRTIYGVYLRKIIFGNLSIDNIVILNNRSNVVSVCEECGLKEVFSSFQCLTYNELFDLLKQEDRNGSGIT